MKTQLNEVTRLQKLAGIISEGPMMMTKPEKPVIKKSINTQALYDLAGKPLLGHFILDMRSTPTQLYIDLAKEPDQKGKSSIEQKAFTINYTLGNNGEEGIWGLGDSPVKPTPEDQQMLDSIVDKIKTSE
jgi:hypothetical protein